MSEVTDFVAVFIGRMMQTATDDEVRNGMTIQAFSHEGVTMPERFVDGIDKSHRNAWIEPGRHAQLFATREEAEAFIASQTERQSGWMVIPRITR